MLQNLVSDLEQYKKIAIFGYGVEGKSFHAFAKEYLPNANIVIVDKNYSDDAEYLQKLDGVDIVIKSPGISLYNLGISYEDYNFTSITELFLKHFSAQIIGITGTKGKSTLATLVHSMLVNAGESALLCGNIGISPLDAIAQIKADTKIVMELSSHQLHHISYSPHIAVLTNLFEEHLDYYRDLKDYYEAKFNIFSHQSEDDIFIYNLEDESQYLNAALIKSHFAYNVYGAKVQFEPEFTLERGYLHHATLQIAEKLALVLNIDNSVYMQTIAAFETLPHRLEFVKKVNGISFVNDSISTIPEATIAAIKMLKNVDSVIIGGNDRGINYEQLVRFLQTSEVQNIILFSDTGEQIYTKLSNTLEEKNLFLMHNLQESIEKAYNVSTNIVLFSPAASSFNEYKNFVERGNEFKKIVNQLKE